MTFPRRHSGFTLIELMVSIAVLAILAAIALPSYRSYVDRARIPAGLDALASYSARMEQLYQDNGNYGTSACGASLPSADNYRLSCTLGNSGQSFVATATGSGPLAGYAYSIDSNGNRATVANPHGLPPTNCWSLKGAVCDS